MTSRVTTMNPKTDSQIILYQAPDGQTKIEVELQGETVWLNQAQMSELFQKDQRTISEHINNVYKEKELEKETLIYRAKRLSESIKENQLDMDSIVAEVAEYRSGKK